MENLNAMRAELKAMIRLMKELELQDKTTENLIDIIKLEVDIERCAEEIIKIRQNIGE